MSKSVGLGVLLLYPHRTAACMHLTYYTLPAIAAVQKIRNPDVTAHNCHLTPSLQAVERASSMWTMCRAATVLALAAATASEAKGSPPKVKQCQLGEHGPNVSCIGEQSNTPPPESSLLPVRSNSERLRSERLRSGLCPRSSPPVRGLALLTMTTR